MSVALSVVQTLMEESLDMVSPIEETALVAVTGGTVPRHVVKQLADQALVALREHIQRYGLTEFKTSAPGFGEYLKLEKRWGELQASANAGPVRRLWHQMTGLYRPQ